MRAAQWHEEPTHRLQNIQAFDTFFRLALCVIESFPAPSFTDVDVDGPAAAAASVDEAFAFLFALLLGVDAIVPGSVVVDVDAPLLGPVMLLPLLLCSLSCLPFESFWHSRVCVALFSDEGRPPPPPLAAVFTSNGASNSAAAYLSSSSGSAVAAIRPCDASILEDEDDVDVDVAADVDGNESASPAIRACL